MTTYRPLLRSFVSSGIALGLSAYAPSAPAEETTTATTATTAVEASAPVIAPSPPPTPTSAQTTIPASVAEAEGYQPLLHVKLGGMVLEAPLSLGIRNEVTGQYTLDRDGTRFDNSAVDTQIRVGARFDSKLVLVPLLVFAEYEHDLLTGPNTGVVTAPAGQGFPNSKEATQQLRKAWGRVSLGQYLHVGGGFTTSTWGLGLVANDGTLGWTPGSARFIDPRGGDRVLRGFVASGPHTPYRIFTALSFDSVVDDDILLDGDSDATQISLAVLAGRDMPQSGGVYVVRRKQNARRGSIEAIVVDATGRSTWKLGDGPGAPELTLEGEIAIVRGEASVAATPQFPVQDIRQLGLAVRSSIDFGSAGGVLELLLASGDANLDDGEQTGFRMDPNYTLGLLLHRQLLTAQSARSPVYASDPNLLGVPPQGIERFPTRGSITNTIAFFPRGFYRPIEGLEIYGGPLFAMSAVPVVDPYNTRLAGGDARNHLNGRPGSYLGTELDLGVRYQRIIAGTELTAGVEGGVLFPGSAFEDSTGRALDRVAGGRAMLRYRF